MRSLQKLKYLFLCSLIIPVYTGFANITFPMTIWGTLTDGNYKIPAGAIVKVFDDQANELASLITKQAGQYGGNTAFDENMVISKFTGNLQFSVTVNGVEKKIYKKNIDDSLAITAECPNKNNIIFTSKVCQYNINFTSATGKSSGILNITENNYDEVSDETAFTEAIEEGKIIGITDNNKNIIADQIKKNVEFIIKDSKEDLAKVVADIQVAKKFIEEESESSLVLAKQTMTFMREEEKIQIKESMIFLPKEMDTEEKKQIILKIDAETEIKDSEGQALTEEIKINPPADKEISEVVIPATQNKSKKKLSAIDIAVVKNNDNSNIDVTFSQPIHICMSAGDKTSVDNIVIYSNRTGDFVAETVTVTYESGSFCFDINHLTAFAAVEEIISEEENPEEIVEDDPDDTPVSSSSSGGGGTSTGVDITSIYTMPVSNSASIVELYRPMSLEKTAGKITRPVNLKNYSKNYEINFLKDSIITYKDGAKFVGVVSVPETVSIKDRPTIPENMELVKMIRLGDKYQRELKVSKNFTLTIPVSFKQKIDPVLLTVYVYKSTEEEYQKLNNITLNEEQTQVTVETDYMSILAVLYQEEIIIKTNVDDSNKKPETSTDSKIENLLFTDIEKHWAQDFIEQLTHKGIFKNQENFRPNDPIRRSEIIKILIEAFQYEKIPYEDNFIDVDKNLWFATYVSTAKKYNIAKGYDDNSFKPGNNVIRAEAIKMVLEAAKIENIEGTAEFSDIDDSLWFASYVKYAADHGIIQGTGNNEFRPRQILTRAQMAKIVAKILK